jgi:hypothetical protein
MFDLIKKSRIAIDKRRRYNQLVSEINALSDRDLADFNGNRDDMIRHVWADIYGK